MGRIFRKPSGSRNGRHSPGVSRESSTVGMYDAKTHFAALVMRVKQGEELTITRHGSPVARLVPVRVEATPEERRAAIERMLKRSQGLSLGGLTVKQLREEGRR